MTNKPPAPPCNACNASALIFGFAPPCTGAALLHASARERDGAGTAVITGCPRGPLVLGARPQYNGNRTLAAQPSETPEGFCVSPPLSLINEFT